MTGKDLFEAMQYVDDELVNEAEETVRKGKGRRFLAKRWYAAAACLCVLAASLTVVTLVSRSGSNAMSGGAVPDMTESSGAGAAETETGKAEIGIAEAGEVEAEKESGQQPANDETGDLKEGKGSADDTVVEIPADVPGAGECICAKAVEEALRRYEGQDVRFLLAFDLYFGEDLVAQDTAVYREECSRLKQAGLEMREVSPNAGDGSRDKGQRLTVLWLLTAKQLETFPADERYGYLFHFAALEDQGSISYGDHVVTGTE